ncbi:hypothetical protein [Bosea sp. (in: a-proteobacteria)]
MLRALLILIAVLAGTAFAGAGELTLVAPARAAIVVTPQSVATLPGLEREVTFATSKGPSTARYDGVLVWDLLRANKLLDGLDPKAQLSKTLLVSAGDGYRIAFSIGEIHPDFGNLPLMLVTAIDGKPLEGSWRLVAPGDKRGARAVRDVATIELR